MTQRDQSSSNETAAPREARAGERSPTESRLAVTVLGMHRSGTSAMARILSLLGADLPRNLMETRDDNPSGHWEPQRIVDLNDELLATASSSWDDVSPVPRGWYGSAPEAELRERAVRMLGEEYPGSRLFVLKDPRICRIVPFWVSALDDYGATPSFVITIRNPLEVAASLRERDEFSISKGLLLWLRHTLDAEHDTRGHPRAFVSYERLLDDWEGQAQGIAEHLQISWPRLNHAARAEVDRYLTAGHRHQRFSASDLEQHAAVVEWVKRCYTLIDRACLTGDTPPIDELSEIAEQVRRADRAYGPLLATARGIAERRRKELEDRREGADLLGAEIERHAAGDAELEHELEARGAEIEGLRAELEARAAGDVELEHELEARGAEIEGLRAELEARVTGGATLRRQLEARRLRAGMAQQELRRRDEEILEKRQAITRLSRELDRRERRTGKREAEIRRLDAELDAIRGDLELVRDKGGQQAGELERHRSAADALRAEVAESRSREAALRAALADRESELGEQQRALSRAGSSVAARDREIDELRRRIETQDTRLEAHEAELASGIEALEQDLDQRQVALAAAEAELDRARARATAGERQIEELRAETEQLATAAAAGDARGDKLQAELSVREGELTERAREVEGLRAEIAARAAQTEELAGHLDEMSTSLETLAGEAEALRDRFAAARDETALTYLAARPRSRTRTSLRLLGWTVWPTRWRQARDFRAIRRAQAFDATFYLLRYPAAAGYRGSPVLHYVDRGAGEGNDPSADFSTTAYLADHPELVESGENPYAHFLRAGGSSDAGGSGG